MIYTQKSCVGRKKQNNQDFIGHKIFEKGGLFIVCDGISSLPKGDIASKTAVNAILQGFTNYSGTINNKLKNAMNEGQESVMNLQQISCGTTAAVCFVESNFIYTAWCGDRNACCQCPGQISPANSCSDSARANNSH